MTSKFILSFLKVSVTILFYLLIFFTLFFFVTALANISGKSNQAKKLTSKAYNYEVKGFRTENKQPLFLYSADSLVRYQPVKDNYTLQIEPNSAIGYYAIIMKLIFMSIGIAILWNFMKVFKQTKLENPFKNIIARRLKMLAILFIASDILKLIDYFLFNSFLQKSISSPHLKLVTDAGNGIITGLIIWIIAMIYQRGIDLQEENALTV